MRRGAICAVCCPYNVEFRLAVESPQKQCALSAQRSNRYDSLDIWRGVACLAVIIVHSAQYGMFEFAGGGILLQTDGLAGRLLDLAGRGVQGVTLFFVISGYCIAGAVDNVKNKPHPTARYFARRFRRIYPPYWVASALVAAMVTVIVFAGGRSLIDHQLTAVDFVLTPAQLNWWHWTGSLTLTETWLPRRIHGRQRLAVHDLAGVDARYEEQFYAVFGLILWLFLHRMFRAAAVVSVVTGIAYLLPARWYQMFTGTFLDGRWLVFAVGIAVYFAVNYAGSLGRAVLMSGLSAAAAVGHYWPAPHLASELVIGSLFGVLLMALHRFDRQLAQMWLLRPLKFCGTLCYSLYLVHYPLVKVLSHILYINGVTSAWQTLLISVPTCVAAALLVAVPFHKYVETRFMNPSAGRRTEADDVRPPKVAIA